MNGKLSDEEKEERELVKLYMELTGASETGARSVFMYVCPEETEPNQPPAQPGTEAETSQGPTPPQAPPGAALVLALLWLAGLAASALAAPPAPPRGFITEPLSLMDAINVALQQNPNILRAQRDLEAAQGVAIQTRAVAIPKLTVTGGFTAVQPSDVDTIALGKLSPIPTNLGVTFGTDKNWTSQIRLVQSLYEGGRVLSSLRTARLTREQATLNYQTAVADTVLEVELAYFDVLLARQQIIVQEASVELLTRELGDTQRRFDAGTVPRFNVLRAQVELANARPRLIRARNSFRIAKNNLANLLGFDVPKDTTQDIPLNVSGKLEAEPFVLELPHALTLALSRRTELESLRKTQAVRREQVVAAQAGYKPSVQAYGGYDIHHSMFDTDLNAETHGWTTGVQLNWSPFDGFATRGRVREANALYERAGVDLEDASRRIELEVRTAHSNFIEAQEVLESQKKNVEEAEEALRLASSRFDAGTGTQLDVLSAQTALTEARSTEVQALHDYASARARLQRAVGELGPAAAPSQK